MQQHTDRETSADTLIATLVRRGYVCGRVILPAQGTVCVVFAARQYRVICHWTDGRWLVTVTEPWSLPTQRRNCRLVS